MRAARLVSNECAKVPIMCTLCKLADGGSCTKPHTGAVGIEKESVPAQCGRRRKIKMQEIGAWEGVCVK